LAKSLAEKFEQILAADPASMIFLELARTLLQIGDAARAVDVCRAGLTHHPTSIRGRVLLGQALLAQEDTTEALQTFQEALALEPDNPYAYNLVAEQLMRRKRFADALPILTKAQSLQPSDLKIIRWIAEAKGEAVEPEEPDPEPPPPAPSNETPAAAAPTPVVVQAPPTAPPVPETPLLMDETTEAEPPPLHPGGRRRVADLLLADLPESKPPPTRTGGKSTPTTPTTSEIERLAHRYESELRAKLDESRQKPKGFIRRHWLPLAILATLVLVGGGGIGGQRIFRERYNREHAHEFLVRAEQGLLLDTYGSFTGALHQLDELLAVNPNDARAKALRAQTQATLCQEYGCADAQRQAALDLAGEDAVRAADPVAVMAARFALASAPVDLASSVLALPDDSAWANYLAGSVLLLRRDDSEALKRFDAALKLVPAHVPTLLAVGDHDLRSGDVARAGEIFSLAHQASPLNVAAAVGLAEVHLSTHDVSADDLKALAEVAPEGERAIPTAVRQRFDLATARVLAANGQTQKAVQRLQDGVAQHGDELFAYASALADVYVSDGQYARAEDEAWRALSRNKQDPEALERYGRILLGRGRYRDVLARVPASGSRRLHVLRAQADLGLGDCIAARGEVEATRKDGKAPALGAVVMAQCDAKAGRVTEAEQTLHQIAGLPHAPLEALLALATLEDQSGDGQQALTDARNAVQLEPRNYEAHCLLGRLLWKGGSPSDGVPELQTSLRLNRQHAEALVALGLLQLDQGQAVAARQSLDEAVASAPLDPQANLALARALLALGLPVDAEHSAARAAKLSPKDPQAHHWLGKIALRAGDQHLALRELKEAKKLDKKDPTIGQDLALAEVPAKPKHHH
jgi:cellulose synthase operon protein C